MRILARADVFVQNLGHGAAERLGLGSERLVRKFPRLVTMDISGSVLTCSRAMLACFVYMHAIIVALPRPLPAVCWPQVLMLATEGGIRWQRMPVHGMRTRWS